ncbi:peptidyl-tRNA hydrolase, PTH1 family [Sporothrix schenckii 1099-18]|uniref:peptidyl-tRNA hydrolase n=1 Tax=Sporothrix schenckii 1099-18 TaxID=1397361 RepID=A0A0F2MHL1_SPOSC|nr:peptidyl-tRNA hydrolase, PTH1 family [Sporothrix schenckii 1099-18]KJR87656.1 peptidyl-tRNA hydrolase, PTH1 family [Sporothrix schenckii 1099-18]
MAGISHVLVLSIGNPGVYLNTLHSAGHVALEALRRELMLPPFAPNRLYTGKYAPVTTSGAGKGTQYTLMQSPTLMNVSGPWVAKVWKGALKAQDDTESTRPADKLGLVLIHDDLEMELGDLSVRPWTRSPRGHNGLKSIATRLRPSEVNGAQWARLSVGIGRPEERDRDAVVDYVLRQMTIAERSALESLGPGLVKTLRTIETQWAAKEL